MGDDDISYNTTAFTQNPGQTRSVILWFRPDFSATIAYIGYFGALSVFDIIPTLLIHWQYYHFSRNITLEIHPSQRKMVLSKDSIEHEIPFENITSVVIRATPNFWRYKGKETMSTWEFYHYAVIHTNDGNYHLVTSLLVNHIPRLLEELGLQFVTKKYFPTFILPAEILKEYEVKKY